MSRVGLGVPPRRTFGSSGNRVGFCTGWREDEGMKDIEFYENILGWRTPWRVEAVTKAVEVKVKYEEGTLWASEAGERLPVYDHVERCWRHLDTCGFETRLRCRVPRVQTPAGKVETVPVPWAEEAEGTREVGGRASRAAQPLYAALRAVCDQSALRP